MGKRNRPAVTTPEDQRLAELLDRACEPEAFAAWQARARATGWCRNPVRLVGAAVRIDPSTGEVRGRFTSEELPDQVLLKACGHRRATRCPACSQRYQADAYQLIAAGLRGGKGVPGTVCEHPVVFVTLTAPSFGLVHREGPDACRPTRGACEHGRARSCQVRHPPDDVSLGQPICPDCFDYRGAVIWNAAAGRLWQRTTIAIRRSLAGLAGMSRRELNEQVRVSFSKVVEYQRRGSVHLHAVVRLDGTGDTVGPPPEDFDIDLLVAAVIKAASSTWVPNPLGAENHPIRWGSQLDVRPVGHEQLAAKAVASYIAKYSTKSTEPAGTLDRKIKREDLSALDQRLNPHLARMVRTAWDLGGEPELGGLRLRDWAHTLGFRGHWLTKSRRYSTTLAALREARQAWQLARLDHERADEVVSQGA